MPHEYLAVMIGARYFDAAYIKKKDGTVQQQFADIENASKDCWELKEALEKYGIKDKGNMQNIYMLEDPSLQDIKLMKKKLDKRLRLGKLGPVKTRYTIIWLFAGHGLLADGGQAIVLNEFDKKKKFYKLFTAEKNIR